MVAKSDPEPGVGLATAAECRAATENVEKLGLEMVVAEEQDPAKRQELAGRAKLELKSAAFRSRVEAATKRCLERQTLRSEARCAAQARSERQLEDCR